MSISVKTYPRGAKRAISAIQSNGGYAELITIGWPADFVVGQEINIFTDIFNSKQIITEIAAPSTYVLRLTIDIAYSSTGTGFLLTDITIPVESFWNASKNTPLKWEFQREDLQIVSIADLSGYPVVTLTSANGNLFTDYGLTVGGSVYLKAFDDNTGEVIYNNIFTILQLFTGTGIGGMLLDTSFVSVSTKGFVNSNEYKENYYLNVTLSSDNWDSKVIKAYPDKFGVIYIDVHDRLQSELSFQDSFNYETINIQDFNIAGWYKLAYQEYWLTGNGTQGTLTDKYYYSFAEQLLTEYSNQFKHLVKDEGEFPLAKFLQKGVPKVYVDANGIIQFPFDFSILSSVGIVKKVEVTYNTSKAIQATTEYTLLNAANALNRIILSGTYNESTIKYIEVYLSYSLNGIKQFYTTNPIDGEIYDEFGAANGQLKEANCILVTASTTITLPPEIDWSNFSVFHFGTAVISITAANTISVSSGGTIYNMAIINTSTGETYRFPCCEVWKNVVLSETVITNGDFSDGSTGWSLGAGWGITGGEAVCDGTAGNNFLRQNDIAVSGTYYEVTYTVTSYNSGIIAPRIGFNGGVARSSVGTFTDVILANGTYFILNGTAFNGRVDNITIKKRNSTKSSFILHGEKGDGVIYYAFVNDCEFTTQDAYFYFGQYGADKNINQSDTDQIIWTPKDRSGNKMYLEGLDDDNYNVGNFILT